MSETTPLTINGQRAHYHDSWLDVKFELSARRSTVWNEIRSGIVTFITMAYIIVVNAAILRHSGKDNNGMTMPFESIVTATALASALGSFLAGWFGNLPFGLAPGMGLNSYFAYGICRHLDLSWRIALACCFFHGVAFLILSLIGACEFVQSYAPAPVKKGITVGLGLFQALIGFEMMGLVVSGEHELLGMGNIFDPKLIMTCVGLLLISSLLVLEFRGALLLGMVFITVFDWIFKFQTPPSAIIRTPTLNGLWNHVDIAGFIDNWQSTLLVTTVLLFVSVLDTAGVQLAAGEQAELIRNEKLPGSRAAFASASIATIAGAWLGTSPVIIHNESCAGIQDGARTGLSAIVVSFLFLLLLPFAPLLGAVPESASAAPLIVVGMYMMVHVKYVNWEKVEEAMPAFLVITVIPLTYSIANGVVAGLLSYLLINILSSLVKRVKRSSYTAFETE